MYTSYLLRKFASALANEHFAEKALLEKYAGLSTFDGKPIGVYTAGDAGAPKGPFDIDPVERIRSRKLEKKLENIAPRWEHNRDYGPVGIDAERNAALRKQMGYRAPAPSGVGVAGAASSNAPRNLEDVVQRKLWEHNRDYGSVGIDAERNAALRKRMNRGRNISVRRARPRIPIR